MSIRVEPSRFARVTQAYASGTLLTYNVESGIRILTVDPLFDADGTARISGVNNSVVRAVTENPAVVIIWQPRVEHGWTLIYDGTVDPRSPRLDDNARDSDELILNPTSGMLHRPSSHADGPDWEWPSE